MITIEIKDLTKQNYDCLVNAANGIGPMGRGIAGALKRAGGEIIQSDAYTTCSKHTFIDNIGIKKSGYNSGQAYITTSGRLNNNGVKNIVHAVTMYTPGSPTSLEICKKALHSAMEIILKNNFESVGFPAFGTGVGMLNKIAVANMMVEELWKYKDVLRININDIDPEFIQVCLKKQIEMEKQS